MTTVLHMKIYKAYILLYIREKNMLKKRNYIFTIAYLHCKKKK